MLNDRLKFLLIYVCLISCPVYSKSNMIFDIEKLSSAEFSEFSDTGDFIYRIGFKKVRVEERKRSIFYFRIRGFKTLVFDEFKIVGNLKNAKFDSFNKFSFPIIFNGFEAETITIDGKKIKLISSHAKTSNMQKIDFPALAKLYVNDIHVNDILSISLTSINKLKLELSNSKKNLYLSPEGISE